MSRSRTFRRTRDGDGGSPVQEQAAGVAAPQLIEMGERMRGVQAGAVVFAGIAVANLANAVFHLIAGRSLGPSGYGDLASLLAVLGLVAFPLGGVQFAIAQVTARSAAKRETDAIHVLYRRATTLGLAAGAVVSLVLVLASVAIQRLLGIESLGAVVLTALAVLPATFAPIIAGLIQGLERFLLFAVAQVLGPVLRVMIVIPFLIAGFGVGGAIGASLAAAVIGVVLPAWYLRDWFTHRPPAPAGDRVALRSTLPVVVGILAFTSLTTFDVIIAKLAFSPDEAGMYGGASFIGRLILYVPAAIVAVLLPKVSSRTALGRKSDDILAKSLLATAGACILATAIYAIAPRLILTLAFGSKYEDAANLLWLFGLAMTGFALTNVLFVYHIGRANPGVSWILCAGALVQLAAFALVHDSGRQLLVVSSTIAYAVLAAVAVLTFSRGFRGRFSVTGRA